MALRFAYLVRPCLISRLLAPQMAACCRLPTAPSKTAEIACITTRSALQRQTDTTSGKIDMKRVNSLFQEVVSGVEDMHSDNPGFQVTQGPDTVRGPHSGALLAHPPKALLLTLQLTIDTPGGQLKMWVTSDIGKELLAFTAPKTDGLHTYTWSAAQEMWTSTKDGHFLKELLARELVYHCKGFPKF